jgi:hypothetical protein
VTGGEKRPAALRRGAARRIAWIALAALAAIVLAIALREEREPERPEAYTVRDRLEQYAPAVEGRLRQAFAAVGLGWPPGELALVAFKDSRKLEVYGRERDDAAWRHVREYPVLAASGALGPKLRAGDLQVPEGRYDVMALNPNSRFHLALRLGYPNAFDRRMAAADGRTELGGAIMIHGHASSVGCLAMGDPAVEDLFVLTALTSPENVTVIISPTDFRLGGPPPAIHGPPWLPRLYADLRRTLAAFPAPQ